MAEKEPQDTAAARKARMQALCAKRSLQAKQEPMDQRLSRRFYTWGFLKDGTPKWMVFKGKSTKMDDLGVPLF